MKRMFTALLLPAFAALVALSANVIAADAPAQLRVGYQKGSVSMVLAKSHQMLEQRFPTHRSNGLNFQQDRKCWRR